MMQYSPLNSDSPTGGTSPDTNNDPLMASINSAITALKNMDDNNRPFIPRSYRAKERNTAFTLMSLAVAAEVAYFFFQYEVTRDGLITIGVPAALAEILALILAGFDFDANIWTVSPRDDADGFVLGQAEKNYSSRTKILNRIAFIVSLMLAYPIGAAGGWLGINPYMQQIHSYFTRLALQILSFILLDGIGISYYVAFNLHASEDTFNDIETYSNALKGDHSLVRWAQAVFESFTVVVYRAIGFASIATDIPGDQGFNWRFSHSETQGLAISTFVGTSLNIVTTRVRKTMNQWFNNLYAYLTPAELAHAIKHLQFTDYLWKDHAYLKIGMSGIVALGLANLILDSTSTHSTSVIIDAVIAAVIPFTITFAALRNLAIYKSAFKVVQKGVLEVRRTSKEQQEQANNTNNVTTSTTATVTSLSSDEQEKKKYIERFSAVNKALAVLVETFNEDATIFWRSAISSSGGRAARFAGFLHFTDVFSTVFKQLQLSAKQTFDLGCIFAPYNINNEFFVFRDQMIDYMSQKAAQAYVYYCLSTREQSDRPPAFHLWAKAMWDMRLYWNGKVDFTPSEVLYALQCRAADLGTISCQAEERRELRAKDEAPLSTLTEHMESFFSRMGDCCRKSQKTYAPLSEEAAAAYSQSQLLMPKKEQSSFLTGCLQTIFCCGSQHETTAANQSYNV